MERLDDFVEPGREQPLGRDGLEAEEEAREREGDEERPARSAEPPVQPRSRAPRAPTGPRPCGDPGAGEEEERRQETEHTHEDPARATGEKSHVQLPQQVRAVRAAEPSRELGREVRVQPGTQLLAYRGQAPGHAEQDEEHAHLVGEQRVDLVGASAGGHLK